MPHPIRLAVVGAGIFARDAHLPALLAQPDRFEIVALYSRTRANAEALAEKFALRADISTDLDALLARPDIDAVDLLLPIEALAPAVEQALRAGKHVISEKPIAPDVATGERLLGLYANYPQQVWMVAENWRYEQAFAAAAEIVQRGDLGTIYAADWALYIPVLPGNKYYHTDWRRSGTFPGGFLLDGGVHHVAVLRQTLGEIASVSAQVKQMRPDLPPADTLSAALEFERGLLGAYTVTYGAGASWANALHVVGERGALRVDRGLVELFLGGEPLPALTFDNSSVNHELTAFADAVQRGQAHRNTPEQALQDVAVVEAMLESAESGRRVQPKRFV